MRSGGPRLQPRDSCSLGHQGHSCDGCNIALIFDGTEKPLLVARMDLCVVHISVVRDFAATTGAARLVQIVVKQDVVGGPVVIHGVVLLDTSVVINPMEAAVSVVRIV